MHNTYWYNHLLFTRPQAFLLLSFFHLKSIQEHSKKFSYFPTDLRTIGYKSVLTKDQIHHLLPILENLGYISIKRESHRKPIIEITLLNVEFPCE